MGVVGNPCKENGRCVTANPKRDSDKLGNGSRNEITYLPQVTLRIPIRKKSGMLYLEGHDRNKGEIVGDVNEKQGILDVTGSDERNTSYGGY